MKKIFKYIFAAAALAILAPAMSYAQDPVIIEDGGLHINILNDYNYATQTGTFTVESFVEGETKIVTTMPPLDVVFLIDEAGATSGDWGGQPIFTAIKNLALGFLDGFTGATSPDVQIAVVGYPNQYDLCGFTNDRDEVSTALSNLTGGSNGGLATALSKANTLLTAQEATNKLAGRESQKVVIVFSQGKLTNSANKDAGVVADAYALKSNFNAMMVSALIPSNQARGDDEKLLEWMSSNYPNAMSATNLGDKLPTDEAIYYKFSSEYNDYVNFFSDLAEEIQTGGAVIELKEASYVKDVLPPSFALPAGTSSIKVYRAPLTAVSGTTYTFGDPEDITGVTVNLDENNVATVTGFNYSYNWCGLDKTVTPNTIHGYKLITEVEYKFNGSVDANISFGSDSGLYNDAGEKILDFSDYVFLRLGSLQVKKSGLKAGETAFFDVTGPDGKLIQRMVLTGKEDGSAVTQTVVLGNLKPGVEVTVAEQTNWRWTYMDITPKSIEKTIPTNGTAAVFEFGAAESKTSVPRNAENAKLNHLEPGKPALSVGGTWFGPTTEL